MPKFTFDDYAVSLNINLNKQVLKEIEDAGIESSMGMDFFELSIIGIDATELHELMEKAFNAGRNSA